MSAAEVRRRQGAFRDGASRVADEFVETFWRRRGGADGYRRFIRADHALSRRRQ